MIQIEDIDQLPLATEFNTTDLLVKINRGGGAAIAEKIEFSLIRSALGDLPISADQLPTPNIVKVSENFTKSAFTDGGGASGTVDMATDIPVGAIFLYAVATVTMPFDGDTSAVLTIGDGSDPDRYNTGTPSVFTVGAKEMGSPSGNRFHPLAATVTLTVTSDNDFGDVTGTAALTVDLYYLNTV